MNALEIQNLSKSFKDFRLENLNLTLPGGCIMGLIGENGAGKSTTVKLILNMLHKDSGSVRILGKSNEDALEEIKEDVGVVLDEVGIPSGVNAVQAGKIMKHAFRGWDSEEYGRLLKQFALPEKVYFGDYSRGMRMKLGLAIALSHHAKLLILDEATSGLDPVVRDEVLDILMDFTRDETHSVLISSHIVSDLEKICDYVAFLHMGRLLLCEEKDALLEEYALVHCSREQLKELASGAVKYQKESPYGVEAIVLREAIPRQMSFRPVSIEELFVFTVKEAK